MGTDWLQKTVDRLRVAMAAPRAEGVRMRKSVVKAKSFYIEIETVMNARTRSGQSHHWRLMSVNGEPVASSETYSSRAKCLQTAKRVAGEAGWEVRQ